MGSRLYVGNLAWEATKDDLMAMFGEVGKVLSATIIEERGTGSSRGFGFVELDSVEAMQEAIALLNGKYIKGRAITVREAKPEGAGVGSYIEQLKDFIRQAEAGQVFEFGIEDRKFSVRREA